LGAKPGVLGKLVKLVHKLDLVKMYIVYIQMYVRISERRVLEGGPKGLLLCLRGAQVWVHRYTHSLSQVASHHSHHMIHK
jgi:hypothetical protein